MAKRGRSDNCGAVREKRVFLAIDRDHFEQKFKHKDLA